VGRAGNNIGPAGAKDLAEALKHNTSLTTLNLCGAHRRRSQLDECVLGGDGLLVPAKTDVATRQYATLDDVERAQFSGANNFIIGKTPHAIESHLRAQRSLGAA
jgi:hypothetical protein